MGWKRNRTRERFYSNREWLLISMQAQDMEERKQKRNKDTFILARKVFGRPLGIGQPGDKLQHSSVKFERNIISVYLFLLYLVRKSVHCTRKYVICYTQEFSCKFINRHYTCRHTCRTLGQCTKYTLFIYTAFYKDKIQFIIVVYKS